jgi:hypothetical protein
MLSGGDHFLLCQRLGVKECLHRCFAEAPSSLMRALFVVLRNPIIETGLQFLDGPVDPAPEGDAVELVEYCLVKALDNTIRPRTFRFRPAVIDILDRQAELIFVPFRIAAIFRATIGEYPEQVNLVLVIERYDAVVEQIGRRSDVY